MCEPSRTTLVTYAVRRIRSVVGPFRSAERVTTLRAIASVFLVLALAACGSSTPSGGGDDGGDDGGDSGSTTDFRWVVVAPDFSEEVKGTTATVSGDVIAGTDSVPAGWSLTVSRPGGFIDLGTYASYADSASGVTADLTVTITAPGGSSCSVGPSNTSISEDGPDPSAGDTFAQATYFGTDATDGRPVMSFAFLWATCDDLPGASGSGDVELWTFGFGSP